MVDFDMRVNEDGNLARLFLRAPAIAIHLLREAIEDIGDAVESIAHVEAPEGPTGALRAHPVDRDEIFVGPSREGAARGTITRGTIVARQSISVPDEPKHAKWVHSGTGIYGPRHSLIRPRTQPFMIFFWEGQWHKRKTVRGQRPNPYLFRAFEEVDATYVPIRMAELRAQIAALT